MLYSINTDLSIEKCKEILNKNIDQSFLFGELKICFRDTSVTIRRRVNNSFTRIFNGKFMNDGDKTKLEGSFFVNEGVVLFIGFFIFLLSMIIIINLIAFINGNLKSIIGIVIGIVIIGFEVFLIKFLKNKGKEDEEYIISRLNSLLNANNKFS